MKEKNIIEIDHPDFFSKIKARSPDKYKIINSYSKNNDLKIGYFKYVSSINKFFKTINSNIKWLEEKELHINFGKLLHRIGIYHNKYQWKKSANSINLHNPFFDIATYRRWKRIDNIFKLFKGVHMGRLDVLKEQGHIYDKHILKDIQTLKRIIEFEKQHTLDSAYGFAIAMSNCDFKHRSIWLKYSTLLKMIKTTFELDKHDESVYIIFSILYPQIYNQQNLV